jgi:hypothetical protein
MCFLIYFECDNAIYNSNEIEERLNSDITKIYNWSTNWLVDFNPQKTKCMLFSTNQGNIKPQILFNNEDYIFSRFSLLSLILNLRSIDS